MDFNSYAIKLSEGAHDDPKEGMCIMECVAYIAGEKHTDRPACACEHLTKLAIILNDLALHPATRQQLLPFVLRLAGSRITGMSLADRALRGSRERIVSAFISRLVKADRALEQAHSTPKYTPIYPKSSLYMNLYMKDEEHLPYIPETVKFYDFAREEKAFIETWQEGVALLDAMLPPLDLDVGGCQVDYLDEKLHELEKVTA